MNELFTVKINLIKNLDTINIMMVRLPFSQFKKLIDEKLEQYDKITVAFDSDADGCSSAALLILYLLEKKGTYPDNVISCFHDVDSKIKGLGNDQLIFILDLSLIHI